MAVGRLTKRIFADLWKTRLPAAPALLAGLLLCAAPALSGPLEAVVGVRAKIPGDARTAAVLGTERTGSGVVIDDSGLVLTIGYLVLEAESAEVVLSGDRVLPAEIVAYDYDTGFGLLRPLAAPGIEPVVLGRSSDATERSQVLVASFGAAEGVVAAYVVSRREFAGYWEYLLPDAIFTAPPHRAFGGAVLLGPDGRLLGIGSLFVPDAVAGSDMPGNMFVPIDALKPILPDLIAKGRAATPPRPWLGLYTEELRGRVFVSRVAPDGPAAAAGLQADDIVLAVKGAQVASQADFFRKVWALGAAGVEVPLTVLRRAGVAEISVTSADRYDYLKLDPTY
jgi:S1-C subfamily serine protease